MADILQCPTCASSSELMFMAVDDDDPLKLRPEGILVLTKCTHDVHWVGLLGMLLDSVHPTVSNCNDRDEIHFKSYRIVMS